MPVIVTLEHGKYYWCTCGETKKQVVICNCQRTHSPPFCDGSHVNRLSGNTPINWNKRYRKSCINET
ncbi:MAG: CDGSH iron-sulfur domain-containing protein [Planctomycetia bacterium]|nr:CDGSH iron-sulfur domain-containing protein [Candidatus Brocadia sp.]QOJ07157.1 MAG: CDGSH iron-sulfur domain-containing protein [Planctomycetia bacterium]